MWSNPEINLVYVDASPNCNDLVFNIGPDSGMLNRQWNIKVRN